jgi:hypothetical protein
MTEAKQIYVTIPINDKEDVVVLYAAETSTLSLKVGEGKIVIDATKEALDALEAGIRAVKNAATAVAFFHPPACPAPAVPFNGMPTNDPNQVPWHL